MKGTSERPHDVRRLRPGFGEDENDRLKGVSLGRKAKSPSTSSPKGSISLKIRATGFEPATLWTQTTCSTKLSYTLYPLFYTAATPEPSLKPTTPTPARILIIRPSALGDVARTVPVLAALKATYPAADIDWVVESGFETVITHHPALRAAIAFPKRAIKAGLRRMNFGPLLSFRAQLRAGNYDLVLDCQGLGRSGLMAWTTRATHRIGHSNAREGAAMAYTQRVAADIEMHTVDRMMTLAAAAGATAAEPDTRLYSSPAARAWLKEQEWSREPFVVLAPTSRWPAKQWPCERFAALASHFADSGIGVVFSGAAGEREQIGPCLDVASRRRGVVDCVGGLPLERTMALIEGAALVVANDSAPLHIAVGFDRPLVALFGPTRVHRVGPYRREADVIQYVTPADNMNHKNGATAIMERISVDEVWRTCAARLG